MLPTIARSMFGGVNVSLSNLKPVPFVKQGSWIYATGSLHKEDSARMVTTSKVLFFTLNQQMVDLCSNRTMILNQV